MAVVGAVNDDELNTYVLEPATCRVHSGVAADCPATIINVHTLQRSRNVFVLVARSHRLTNSRYFASWSRTNYSTNESNDKYHRDVTTAVMLLTSPHFADT